MGLSKAALKILLNEVKRRSFSGRLLTLGKQDVHFSNEFLAETAGQFGVGLETPAELAISRKPEFAKDQCITDRTLFTSLGFSECQAMDYSDFEQAEILFDLNSATLPPEYEGAFDVIIDGGTIEHVFHLPNALNNLVRMLRVGGRIIHISPSSNHTDHGFYMFSPTLFWDFYRVNQFEINGIQLCRHTLWPNLDAWELIDYCPGVLDKVSFGGLDGGMYAVVCIVTKTAAATGDKIPQQGMYVRTWPGNQPSEPRRKPARPWLYRAISDGYKSTRTIRHAFTKRFSRWRYLATRKRLARMGLKVSARY